MSRQEVKDIDAMREAAEKEIQKILLELEYDTGETINAVNVDTRLYANFAVSVFFTKDQT